MRDRDICVNDNDKTESEIENELVEFYSAEAKRIKRAREAWLKPPTKEDYDELIELAKDFHISVVVPRDFKSRMDMDRWRRKFICGKDD